MVKIFSMEDYERETHNFDARLKRYAVSRWGRRKLSSATFRDLLDRRTGRLLSASASARIAVATVTMAELAARLRVTRRRQAFFVTFTPAMGAVRIRDVLRTPSDTALRSMRRPRSDIRDRTQKLKEWAREQLVGTSYLGSVEIAYYTRHPTSEADGPVISLHVHAVVWGVTRADLDERVARLNASNRSFIPTLRPADVKSLNTPARVQGAILYALKPPLEEYRAFPDEGKNSTREWQQKSRAMRPGDASQVAQVLVGVELDELMIEGGEALGITRTITAKARRALHREEHRIRREFERLRGV